MISNVNLGFFPEYYLEGHMSPIITIHVDVNLIVGKYTYLVHMCLFPQPYDFGVVSLDNRFWN